MAKLRIDQWLVDQGLAESRTRAQALIMAGLVYDGTKRLDKAGQMVAEDAPISVKGQDHPWVSRGGLKLAKAIEQFALNPAGKTALDIGASTGGFTDVLLHYGAAKVYAVDVGHGQLDWKLRNDSRVVVMEQTNARHLTPELIPDAIDWLVCDASFISLKTVLPAGMALCVAPAELVALIKPQFEVGRENVGKGGVVRDALLHQAVCDTIAEWMNQQPGWSVQGITESPITGPKGNKEFLLWASRR